MTLCVLGLDIYLITVLKCFQAMFFAYSEKECHI
jgi:hypothetical protein